jgi:hypothetical protein
VLRLADDGGSTLSVMRQRARNADERDVSLAHAG